MYIYNPKGKDSGMITCAPQTTACPRQCADCFAQAGRAYAELPNVPPVEITVGKVVRIGDISDAFHQLDKSIAVAELYDDCFMNSSFVEIFNRVHNVPVVLTVNPEEMTDTDFHRIDREKTNLMYVRFRANVWNALLARQVVDYYTEMGVPVVLTWMAYYETPIPEGYEAMYEWHKRVINSYWCLKKNVQRNIEGIWQNNSLVYSCGYKGGYSCVRCGNCLREYYATKERIIRQKEKERASAE